MKYYIAIDAGGGKTNAVLVEQTGKVVRHILGGSANPFDIGADIASTRISGIMNTLRKEMPEGGNLAGIYCSVSAIHYFPHLRDSIVRSAKGVPCYLGSVVTPVMTAVLGNEDGVGLISGTGAYCYVKQWGKEGHYFGSSGYLFDIGGSAYSIARDGIVAALRERDGRGEETMLTKIIEKITGENVYDHLPVFYVGGREYIASFAPCVFEAWEKGDKAAEKIIRDNAACYTESLQKAAEMFPGPFRVAMGGGVFTSQPEYAELVKMNAPKEAEFIMIDVPAVYGCALRAIWGVGEDVPEDFKENFTATYQ